MSEPPSVTKTSRELGDLARTQAYVPLRLVQQLGPRPETSLQFRGTAMVADISEYAALLETFSRSGKDGVEGLWQVLGRAFASALELVDAYGGEVVYFAGDALVCYWPETEGDLDTAAVAVTCARRLLRQRLTVTSDQGVDVPVRFHIGLGSGELWAARMGGWSGRWNLLFGGAAVRAAFAALRTAGPGRLAAAGTALQALTRMGRHSRGSTSDLGAPGAGAATLDESRRLGATAHLDLLPPAVEQRAEAEDAEWAAEWRRIDSLFLRLPDLDESLPNGPAAFRTVLSVTQETLDSASVTGRAVIDDRGLTLVWVAGEPLSAHPRDQSAGLRLAATLVTRLRRQGFRAKAGFASGVALCGALGSARRRDIIALGTPMVLAARLMDQDGEGLLVHAADVPEDAAGLRVQPLRDVLLKGMVHSAPVCRVEGESEVEPASQVVGRHAEITLFEALLDDLPGGKGGLCLVEGVAGMGKSVLLRELQRRAAARGVGVTVAQALDAERRVPYFAWRAVFRRFFGDLMNEDPSALNGRLMELIVQSGRDPLEAPLLNVVLPVDFLETSLTSDMKGDDRARITRDLLLALLDRRIQGPHVLAFEDVHLMDSASIALFGEIAARLSRVLFVATARPDADESDGVIARLATVRIQLQPVSAAVVAEMARVTSNLELSPQLAEQIREKARGVALYVRAYVHNLRRAVGASAAGPIDSLPDGVGDLLPAPDPVQGVLVKSFDGLSAPDNRVLKIASVVGERFSAQLVEAVLVGKSAALDVKGALETACRRGIIEPEATLLQTYRFAHALLQSTCYETIPLGHRRELHRRVGAALESDTETVPELSDEQLVTLAHHFSRAGEYRPTVRYAEAAAARANRQGAFREAMRLLDLCLQVKPPDGERHESFDPRVRWHRLKAEVAGAGGDRAVRQSEAEAALARAGCRPLPPRLGAGVAIGGSILWRAIVGPGPLQVSPLRPDAERSRELSRAYRQLAVAGYFSGNVPQTAYGTIGALRHASRLGRSPELVDALASMGTCLGIIGFARAGRRYLEAATAMAAQIGSSAGLSFSYVATALFLVGQGEWQRAQFHAARCQEIALRGGDAGNWGNALALRFWMHHYQGDHAQADALAGELADAARAARNAQHQSWAARFRALGHMRRGEWATAREALQESRTLFAEAAGQRREMRPIYELMPVLCDLGATLVALDRRAEGLALCEQALTELEKPRRPSGHALLEGYSSLAAVSQMAVGKDGPAPPGDFARRTLAALERYCRIFPIGRPRLALWQGRALSARKPQAAFAIWQRGLQSAGELGMRHDESLLRQELGAGPGRS